MVFTKMGYNSRLITLVIGVLIILVITISGLAMVYFNSIESSGPTSNSPSTLSITSITATKLDSSQLKSMTPDYFNSVNVPNVSYSLTIYMQIHLNKTYSLYTEGLNACSFSSYLVNNSNWKFANLVYNCPTSVTRTFNSSTYNFFIGEILVPIDYNFNVTYPINVSIVGNSITDNFPLKLTSTQFTYQIKN